MNHCAKCLMHRICRKFSHKKMHDSNFFGFQTIEKLFLIPNNLLMDALFHFYRSNDNRVFVLKPHLSVKKHQKMPQTIKNRSNQMVKYAKIVVVSRIKVVVCLFGICTESLPANFHFPFMKNSVF